MIHVLVILCASMLCWALGRLGAWSWRASRGKQEGAVASKEVVWERDYVPLSTRNFIETVGVGGAVNTDELAREYDASSYLLAPKYTTYHSKSCPKCRRLFPDWMAVCAVDGSVLEVPISQVVAENHAVISSSEGQKMTRCMCVRCQRRFSDQVSYCGYDGTALIKDNPEASRHARTYVVCQSCGFGIAAAQGEPSCRCEVPQALELDPSCLKAHAGGFVSLRCPSCSQVGTAISPVCGRDGSLMMPVDVFARHCFPEKGWGPAGKMCGTCGGCFGASLRFCPQDGQALKWVD